jgi:hypothetical protein
MLHEACVWECKTENRMIFKHGTFSESSPPALIQKVEQSLMDKRKQYADDVAPLILALQSQGLLNRDHSLSDAGMEAVIVSRRIGSPVAVFSKAVGKSLEDMSSWELYRELQEFDHRLLAPGAKKKDCLPFLPGKGACLLADFSRGVVALQALHDGTH